MFNHNSEERIKLLEEEVAWLRKDLINLMNIIEYLEPETHYHVTYHFHTSKENLNNNLEDFME